MEDGFYRISADGRTAVYPSGTPFGRIAEDFQKDYRWPIVLVTVNGRLRELHKTLTEDSELCFLTTADPAGHEAYRRSMILLLLEAVYHVAGRENVERVILHYSVGSGFYCTLRGKVRPDEAFLSRVKAHMLEVSRRRVPIIKQNISTYEARKRFASYGMPDKEKLFRYRRVSRVNIYRLEGFEDYFYGYMVCHTGYLKHFDLYKLF